MDKTFTFRIGEATRTAITAIRSRLGMAASDGEIARQAIEGYARLDSYFDMQSNVQNSLLSCREKLKHGITLTQMELLFIAEQQRDYYQGNNHDNRFVVSNLSAFAVGLDFILKSADTSYFLGNLVEKSGSLKESVAKTIDRFKDSAFEGSPEFPCRNLTVLLRDYVITDIEKYNEKAREYFSDMLLVAIRQFYEKERKPVEIPWLQDRSHFETTDHFTGPKGLAKLSTISAFDGKADLTCWLEFPDCRVGFSTRGYVDSTDLFKAFKKPDKTIGRYQNTVFQGSRWISVDTTRIFINEDEFNDAAYAIESAISAPKIAARIEILKNCFGDA